MNVDGDVEPPHGRQPSRAGRRLRAGRERYERIPQKSLRAGLVLYGFLLAAAAVAILARHAPAITMLGTRQDGVRDALNALKHGAPPLTGRLAGSYYSFGGADQGIYLYLPWIGQLFHQSNPNLLMKWFFLGAFALPIAVYPLVFSELLGSVALGLLAPWLLLLKTSFSHFADVYWAYVWATVFALPLLMLVYQRWGGRRPIWALLGIMLLASFSDTIRTDSGLPVLLAALLLLALVKDSRLRKLLVAAGCVLAFLAVTPGLFMAVRALRDDELHSSSTYSRHLVYSPAGVTSGFWHSMYIGLAFVPNHYGIFEFNDNLPYEYVKRVKPSAKFLSPEYEAVLRSQFFHLLSQDPGFVVGAEAQKTLLVIDDGLKDNKLLLLLLPPLLLLGTRRCLMRRRLLLAVPALGVLAVPSIITIPIADRLTGYEFGFLGALAFVWIVTVLSILRYAIDAIRTQEAPCWNERRSGRRRPPRNVLLTGGVLLGCVGAATGVHIAAGEARLLRYYSAGAGKIEIQPARTISYVSRWSFSGGLPPGWTIESGVQGKRAPDGLALRTNASAGYQLTSSRLRLTPGLYRLDVRAGVMTGGLSIGILADYVPSSFLGTADFWHGQTVGGARQLPLSFQIRAPTTVQAILSNWSPDDQPSTWLLQRISLRRVVEPAPAAVGT